MDTLELNGEAQNGNWSSSKYLVGNSFFVYTNKWPLICKLANSEPQASKLRPHFASLLPLTIDDYGTLAMAEVLLEECLQENVDILRSSTPLLDKTQPGLCRAKSHLNTILSRGRLTVSPVWLLSL